MSNPLDDYLEHLRQYGQVESQGVFTLDLARALEKLTRFRLPTPSCYLLKFVQAAVRAGAEAVRFDLRCDYVEVGFLVDGREFDDVTETANWMQRPDHVPEGAQQHLVVAISSALANPFRRLCWSVATAEQTRLLVIEPDALAIEAALGDPALGDRSQCRFLLQRSGHGTQAQKRFVDERDTLMARCAFATIAVEVNRKRADQPELPTGLLGEYRVSGQGLALPPPQLDRLQRLSPKLWVDRAEGRFRKPAWCKVYGQAGEDACRLGSLLRLRQDWRPTAQVVFDGVLSQPVPLPHHDLEAVLSGPFRSDLSGLAVVHDERFEQALDELQKHYKDFAARLALHLPIRHRLDSPWILGIDIQVGRALGPYRVVDRVGNYLLCLPDQGKSGNSCLLRQLDPAIMDRIQQWERLHHPNLARVETWCAVEHNWLILQVKSEFPSRPPANRQALGWASQLAAALAELHRQSMLHGELRPECLYLTHAGELALGPDLAHFDARQAHQNLPDPTFYSPEAMGGGRSPLEDQYRWGLLAFWLLCGRPPFETPNPVAAVMAHLQEAPPDPRTLGVPDRLAEIILKTLEKDPGQRFASMDEVVAALASA
ncbi:MAG: hypothetical protein KC910_03255 [Candidatus Eremiobacteraeota bacterium]|nr:hypothetical protein [Candidatus Eremiobacteraeota bacterium]